MPEKQLALLAGVLGAITLVPGMAAQPAAEVFGIRPENRLEAFFAQLASSDNTGKPQRFTAILDFLPSFHPESRIVLRCGFDSSCSVVYQTFRLPLHKVAENADRRGNRSAASDLARQAGLEESRFPMAAGQAWSWLGAVADSLAESARSVERDAVASSESKEVSVQLDGTLYAVILDTGDTHVSLALQGPEFGTPGGAADPPIIGTMSLIRGKIVELSKQHR